MNEHKTYKTMKTAVFDTYVRRPDEVLMHFDIIVQEGTDYEAVQRYGRRYLSGKGYEGLRLSPKECRFCHIEEASTEMQESIKQQGYFILEMQGCN